MKKAHQKRNLPMHLHDKQPSMKRLFLRHLYTLGRCQMGIAILDLLHHILRQSLESLACKRIGVQSDRLTDITALADALHNGNLTSQRHVQLLRQTLAALLTEEVVFVLRQLSRCEPSHVLDQA